MRRLPAYATRMALALVIASLGASQARAQGQNSTNGRDVFRTRCAMCHGAEGRGDGPAGAAFNPRPTNLTTRVQRIALTDSAVAAVITAGRRAMPAFGRMLTKPQVDSVVAYMKTLSP